jgi:hypothetical protein
VESLATVVDRFGDLKLLVVADASVRRLKGPGRPVNTLADRMAVLAALSCIDHLVAFQDDSPAELVLLGSGWPPAFLAGLLQRATLLVGNDSGPRHLAAAVGTATVAVYWIPNLVNVGPLRRARHRAPVSWRLDCPACGADALRGHCGHGASLVADVGVEEVLAEALDVFTAELDSGA